MGVRFETLAYMTMSPSRFLCASQPSRESRLRRPFVVLPTVAIASRAIPKQHRPKFWVGTLVFYGLVSTVMYNTDTSGDG